MEATRVGKAPMGGSSTRRPLTTSYRLSSSTAGGGGAVVSRVAVIEAMTVSFVRGRDSPIVIGRRAAPLGRFGENGSGRLRAARAGTTMGAALGSGRIRRCG